MNLILNNKLQMDILVMTDWGWIMKGSIRAWLQENDMICHLRTKLEDKTPAMLVLDFASEEDKMLFQMTWT